MKLLAHFISPRLRYISGWLGMALTGEPLQIITSADEVEEGEAVINYSSQVLIGGYQIYPAGLLVQKDIPARIESFTELRGLKCLFPSKHHCDHGFDILSASFYLLSRAEEYLPHTRDEYDRYPHTDSLAFRNACLHRPVVDEWLSELRERLIQRYPSASFKKPEYKWLPTYDVDQAFQYYGKNAARQTAGYLRDALRLDFKTLKARYRATQEQHVDAFDVFGELLRHHERTGIEAMFFWLVAARQKGYDVNTPRNNKAYQTLLKRISEQFDCGVHFSWAASNKPAWMHLEKHWLEKKLNRQISGNRMHYIHFNLPHTFRHLIQAGITDDYSMGYGSINGFRAGTSQSFYWYDLQEERETTLLLHPFAWMEANSIFEVKERPEASAASFAQMRDYVKQHGGRFITIAHNHLLGKDERGRKWWAMYKNLKA